MNITGYCTFAMEVLGLHLLLALLASKQYVYGQGIYNIPCIPPLPDFESRFQNTLRLRPEFRARMEEIKRRRFLPAGCYDFDSSPVDNVWALNVQRCTQGTYIQFQCIYTTTTPRPTTSTSTVATTTTTDYQWGTTTKDPGGKTTTTEWRGPPTRSTRPTRPTQKPDRTSRPWPETKPPDFPPSGGGKDWKTSTTTQNPGDQDTSPGVYIPGVTPVVAAKKSSGSPDTITIVISVGAGLLGLMLIIGILLLCRKHLYVGSGATDAHLKHEKVQRQRSDCQPISAISPNLDTYDPFDPASPSIHTVYGGYNRGFVTNGRKWRPGGEVTGMGADTVSEAGSQKSSSSSALANSHYIILREDSTSSAYNFDYHYNTLRAIDHPHALTTSGFGESSTDATLPRTLRKKRSRSGDVAETDFCYSAEKGSRDSSRCASRESIVSDVASDIFGSRASVKSTGSLKRGGHVPNGMVIPVPNGDASPSPALFSHRLFKKNSSRNSSRQSSVDLDNQSRGTIDEADRGLDVSNRSLRNHSGSGRNNPAFRGGDEEINVDDPVLQSEKEWRSLGLNSDPERSTAMDSIVSTKNIDLFSYDNHAHVGDNSAPGSRSTNKGRGKNGYVDPPLQFRDPNEPAVAIIQPVKGKERVSRQNAVDRNDNDVNSKRSDSKKSKPAVSKKPTRPVKNGSIPVAATPPYSHTPSHPPSSGAAHTSRSPGPGPKISNGKLPHHESQASKSSFLHTGTDWSQTNGHHHKPAAQVNPLPKQLADVRL